jgi:hypothetical protein
MKKFGILAIICFAILSMTYCCTAMAQDQPDSTHQISPITTPEQAIARALAYTGFDQLPTYSPQKHSKAEKVVVTDSHAPFAGDWINGHQVWRVIFKKVPIGSGIDSTKRDFQVLLDSTGVQLLDIYSISKKAGSSDTLPEPPAKNRFNKAGSNGLARGIPPTTLIQAFQKIPGNPAQAKVIRVAYNYYMFKTNASPQTWIIILRGVERPIPHHGPGGDQIPIQNRNITAYYVDAVVGQCMFFGYSRDWFK